MTIDQLRSLLQASLQGEGQQAQLVITRATFNDARVNQLMDTCYGGSSIVINTASISEEESADSHIVVTGQASFLNVVNIPVRAVFQASPDQVDFVLCYQLPSVWKFSQSFPTLPATWSSASQQASSPDNSLCSLLDTLTFTHAAFFVSTMPYTDPTYQVQFSPGLNFACDLSLQGLLGAIEQAIAFPDPLTLAGPIIMPSLSPATNPLVPPPWPPLRNTAPLPGINLKANANVDLSLEQMRLDDVYLLLYSPLAEDDANAPYEPSIIFGGTLHIQDQLAVEVTAKKILGLDDLLTLNGTFEGLTLSSLGQFVNLTGKDDLLGSLVPAGAIPPFYQEGSNLSLQAASLTVTCSPFAVAATSLVVGLDGTTWTPLEGFSVSNLEVFFGIANPFNGQRSLGTMICGTVSSGEITLDMSAQVPEFTVTALLPQGRGASLQSLLPSDFPPLPQIGDLMVDAFYLQIQPATGALISAALADQPQPWTIQIGPETLALSNMQVSLNYTKGAPLHGAFSGTLTLAGVQLDVSYQFPGPLVLRGQLPSLSLKSLLTEVCGSSLAWPAGFDVDLARSSILIQEQNGNFVLNLATDIEELGLLACTLQRQTNWGFALGLDLNVSSLAALPGLSILAPFDAFVGLDSLLLVFSSLGQQPDFQFPDLASFNVPALGNRKLTLPPQANGLSDGFNLYAQLNTSKSGGFQALAKYLGINLAGNVGITLAVSLPDPATNSKFFLSVSEEIQQGTTLVGELGGFLQGSDIGAFLTAVVKTQVQGQPMEFDVSALVLENGVLISGTMQGTLHFESIHLSNLALVIGIDLEGIPSLGIAATLDVSTFESALAIFFDSADPAKSLAAGSISSVSLLDIARTFAGQSSFPHELESVLNLIGLKALSAFSMPASTAPLLDQRDISGIANAFKQYGSVTLPGTSDRLLLVINRQGTLWHLTDLSTMKHYRLALQGGQVAVSLEPQVYIAPQMTTIGSLQFPLGFHVIAQIDYLLIQAEVNIQIQPQQGVSAEVVLKPIVLLNPNFFSLTGANGQGGPRFSLATYAQPQLADPQLRAPHVLLSGNLRLLGADMAGIYLSVNEQGMVLQFSYQVNPLLHLDLNGSIDSHSNLSLQVGVLVGINRALDLGQLGLVQVNTQVNGRLAVSLMAGRPSASFSGGFVFQNISCAIPPLTLDPQSAVLRDIEQTLWKQISDIINKILQDPKQWLTWVHSGTIQHAGQSAEEVGAILSRVYHLASGDIAAETQQIMGYGSDGVARALKGAGSSADETVRVLKNLGYQTADIATTIPNVFPHTHADTIVGHVDTPAGPHLDTPTTHADVPATHGDSASHLDVPRSHVDSTSHTDVPAQHADGHTIFGHADTTITPHGDSNPHADTTTTPHADSNPHADTTTTPHADSSTPHADSPVPPHGDTGTHVDIKP